jgi:hypothetical protein
MKNNTLYITAISALAILTIILNIYCYKLTSNSNEASISKATAHTSLKTQKNMTNNKNIIN